MALVLPKNNNEFCSLKRLQGGVCIITFLGDQQHRFTPNAINEIDKLLDEVAEDVDARILITTNEGKFFSNGMDVNYLWSTSEKGAKDYLLMFQKLASKILTFCLPTIAIIRGHAVGAGFLLALAHDYRVMSSTRLFIFMSEVHLGMSLTPGNVALLRAKLPLSTFQEAILTGKRYDKETACVAGVVHATGHAGETLVQETTNRVMEYNSTSWKREVYHSLKMEMFKTTVRELENGGVGFARM